MNRKQLLTAGLLGFVAISLVLAVANVAGWRRTPATPSQTATQSPATTGAGTTTTALTAIYFHAPHRCPTCKKIEAYTHEALQPAIADKQIVWKVADYTASENAVMVDRFKVLTSTVVLTETRNGEVVRFRNVEEVWDHTHNQTEFVAFMRDAWNGFREPL
jgi:hypothetical protein